MSTLLISPISRILQLTVQLSAAFFRRRWRSRLGKLISNFLNWKRVCQHQTSLRGRAVNAWEDTVLYNTEMLWKLLHYGLMAFKKVHKQFKKLYQKILSFFKDCDWVFFKCTFLKKIGRILGNAFKNRWYSRRSKEQYMCTSSNINNGKRLSWYIYIYSIYLSTF